jgi:hypothetical protein
VRPLIVKLALKYASIWIPEELLKKRPLF